jgi:predicted TIM-barrel fold metal-dependent hydrolase
MIDGMFTVVVEEHFATQAILDRTASVDGPMDAEAARRQVPLLLDLGDRRLAAMDEAGIDVQVVSHTAPGLEWVNAVDSPALAREANDVLLDAIAKHPDRLTGLAALPVSAPRVVAAELQRAVELGLKGALINGTADGRFLDDPAYGDLLMCAEALGVPLYVHPGVPLDAVKRAYYAGFPERVSAVLATAAWGWHAETAVHVLRIILAGTFDRHPDLNIVVGHMGEMLPVMAVRAETLLRGVSDIQRPLREYFADNVYMSTAGVFDHHAFAATRELVGIDRVMISIDYPYVPAAPAMAFLRGVEISDEARAGLAGGNAARLFGVVNTASRESQVDRA